MGSSNGNATSGLSQGIPKQRLKSATMNKRIPRGFSRDNHDEPGSASNYDQSEGPSHAGQQYHGYTGHLSNPGMPPVNSSSNIGSQQSSGYLGYMGGQRQAKTASGVRPQTWKGG